MYLNQLLIFGSFGIHANEPIIIIIYDFIIIWDHAFDFGSICVVCVCSSWPEY